LELSKFFVWKYEKEIKEKKAENEIVDIYIFLLYLSHHFDIEKAVSDKIKINDKNVPNRKEF
jgi:hypothetical protein